MNTSSITGLTRYFSNQSNSSNNFVGWAYSVDGALFKRIVYSWQVQNQSFTIDNSNDIYIVAQMSFVGSWTMNGAPSALDQYLLPVSSNPPTMYMTTSSFTNGTTKLLFFNSSSNFGGDNNWYISQDSINFNKVNLSTATISTIVTLYVITHKVFNFLTNFANSVVDTTYNYASGVYGLGGQSNELLAVTNGGLSWWYSNNGGNSFTIFNSTQFGGGDTNADTDIGGLRSQGYFS
jgi:hypothetical protein